MQIRQFLQNTWSWYLGRKLWQRILIGFFALAIITSPFNSSSSTNSPVQNENSKVATPSESVSATPSESASATPSAAPMSPVEFRVAALGDLRDMRKDVADLKSVLAEGGRARLITNTLELSFNLGQLQSLDPTDEILLKWSDYLKSLEESVDSFSDGLSEDSTSLIYKKLDVILAKISSAESYVKSVS